MKLRIGSAVLGALGLAAVTVWGTAGSASAVKWDHTYRDTGVKVYVEERGDIVSACDTAADGYGVSVDVYPPGHLDKYTLTVTNGKGSCKTSRASQGGLHNLEEGGRVDLVLSWGGNEYSFVNDH